MQKVIVIVGPTAVGKTAVSIELAKTVQGEIVSADSRQVYRGLDIGSGKVTPKEMQGIPHHLIDVADPREVFSVALYAEKAQRAISDILKRGHIPIIVGGTGFYVDVLLGTTQLPGVEQDKKLREELSTKNLPELREELEKLDPERMKTIDSKNRVRLVRAIEIAKTMGSIPPLSSKKLFDVLWIGLTLPKEELTKNISDRLHTRLKTGMLEEAKKLHAKGLSFERMEELGLEYRYLARYLAGDISHEEFFNQLETEIQKYAKRQITWFKKNKEIHWFLPTQKQEVIELAQKFLENF